MAALNGSILVAADPGAFVRPSARVARVAELLDVHPCDIRRMIAQGDLEAHSKGVRGVRVFLDSVRDYQDRHTKPAPGRCAADIHKRKARSAASTASFRAAMAGLTAKGLV